MYCLSFENNRKNGGLVLMLSQYFNMKDFLFSKSLRLDGCAMAWCRNHLSSTIFPAKHVNKFKSQHEQQDDRVNGGTSELKSSIFFMQNSKNEVNFWKLICICGETRSSLQSNERAEHAEGVAPTPCTRPSLTSSSNVKHCLNAWDGSSSRFSALRIGLNGALQPLHPCMNLPLLSPLSLSLDLGPNYKGFYSLI